MYTLSAKMTEFVTKKMDAPLTLTLADEIQIMLAGEVIEWTFTVKGAGLEAEYNAVVEGLRAVDARAYEVQIDEGKVLRAFEWLDKQRLIERHSQDGDCLHCDDHPGCWDNFPHHDCQVCACYTCKLPAAASCHPKPEEARGGSATPKWEVTNATSL